MENNEKIAAWENLVAKIQEKLNDWKSEEFVGVVPEPPLPPIFVDSTPEASA